MNRTETAAFSPIEWYEEISLDRARRILGGAVVDRLLASGVAGYVSARAARAGAWDANDREAHAAYSAICREVDSRADAARTQAVA